MVLLIECETNSIREGKLFIFLLNRISLRMKKIIFIDG